jgi:hypothetical protein
MPPRLPGGPDRPPARARWKVKPKKFKTVRAGNGMYVLPRPGAKPSGPKPTTGNRYTSAPPPVRTTTGPGSVGSGTAPRGPIPIDPYAKYREKYPWAWAQLTDIDRAQASHQQYAGQVGDWLSKGLQGLTGIDPNQPGYNPAVQQQYMANVAGQVGGALNAGAVATPAQVAAPGMGGVVQGNNAFMGQAAREANAQRSSAAIQMSQAQSALNTMQPNTFAQGAMRAYADMQAGLPGLYATRRMEARSKIDQFIMQSEEEARHNRVTEAISAQNAQTNAALSFAQLGLKADDQAFDQTQDLSESAADQAAAGAPAPYGYQRDPATGKLVRDPSVASASSAAPKAPKGTYNVNELRKQGFIGGWKVKPKKAPQGAKGTFVKAANGTWWIKAGSGSGTGGTTGKPNVGKPAQDVYTALVKANDDSMISVDQNEGTADLIRFLKKYQPDKENFKPWFADILEALGRVDPQYKQWIAGYVKRRMQGVGGVHWKGTF